MNISAESYGHAVLLKLKGDLTEDVLNVLQQTVDHQLESKEVIDLALDFQNVPVLDSAALEYLCDLQERLSERLGRVRLVCCDENVRKIIEITRLDNLFDLFDNPAEAVKAPEA